VHYGIGLLPFFPLASGVLTGKYQRGVAAPEGSRIKAWGMDAVLDDRTFDVLDALQAFANERSIGLLEVAIGGLAAQPAVSSVIAGATTPEQVAANVKAGEWQPTAEDVAEINRITAPGALRTRP
jgi:aryl-alcohol dehydrogenase-like predicted oxidoreductase